MSFHASLQQFYRCTLTRCGVWNGVIVVSFWRARAEIVRALSTLSIYSQFQILTYPCTCIYETTNFLLGVLRGPSTILYCCRLARRLSRCGIRRFAVVPCSRKSRPLNSSVVIEAHSIELVSALAWLPDGSGFISASQDRKINLWVRPCLLATCCLINFRLRTAVQGSNIANAEE